MATLLMVLAMAGFLGDLALNKRRILYAMLGRDHLVATCRAPLAAQLRALGFEPSDITFGDLPDITFSTDAGKTLRDTITFTDGGALARVDGIVTCSLRSGVASVEVQTATTPVRTT